MRQKPHDWRQISSLTSPPSMMRIHNINLHASIVSYFFWGNSIIHSSITKFPWWFPFCSSSWHKSGNDMVWKLWFFIYKNTISLPYQKLCQQILHYQKDTLYQLCLHPKLVNLVLIIDCFQAYFSLKSINKKLRHKYQ